MSTFQPSLNNTSLTRSVGPCVRGTALPDAPQEGERPLATSWMNGDGPPAPQRARSGVVGISPNHKSALWLVGITVERGRPVAGRPGPSFPSSLAAIASPRPWMQVSHCSRRRRLLVQCREDEEVAAFVQGHRLRSLGGHPSAHRGTWANVGAHGRTWAGPRSATGIIRETRPRAHSREARSGRDCVVISATPPRSLGEAPFVELHERHSTDVLAMSNGAPPEASATM